MTQITKMHNISSDFYVMRKILMIFFGSHGTLLGYPLPGSQNWLAGILCHIQNLEGFLVVIDAGIVTFMTSDS